MLNLAFIGSRADAARYGAISNRLHGARWSLFVPLDGPESEPESSTLGLAIESASIPEMLASYSDDVDALVIHASPEDLQKLVKTAATSAKPMLIGPLSAKHGDDLNALFDLAQTGSLTPACSWRFIPAIQAVKASIDAGNLGDLGLIRIHRWNSQQTEKTHDLSSRIIPDIDIVTWFFGEQPQKILAMTSRASASYLQMHLHFDNGGMAVIDEAGALPDGGDYFSLTVIGATGAAYADDHRNMNLIVDGVYPHAIRTEQGLVHLAMQLQSFVDSVRSDSPHPIGQRDVADVLQVTDAALRSAAANQVFVWKEGRYV